MPDKNIDLTYYTESGTWDVLSGHAYINKYRDVVNGQSSTDVTFYITIRWGSSRVPGLVMDQEAAVSGLLY